MTGEFNMNKNNYRLSEELIKRSVAQTWPEAKREWELEDIFDEDDPHACICRHWPIYQLCIICNVRNGNRAIVGNCCVKKFLGLPSAKILAALRRVRDDVTRSLNPHAIEHALKKGWITQAQRKFYLRIWRKRRLSAHRLVWKIKINDQVLAAFRRVHRLDTLAA